MFSQVLSFGIADLILYVECCLVYNKYVSVLSGGITALLQIIGTACIVMWTKQYLMKHVPAKKTIIIYGKEITREAVEAFKERLLRKYSHLFAISDIVCENPEVNLETNEIMGYDVAILYELSGDIRGSYIRYLAENKKTFYMSPKVEDIMLQGCVPKHLLDTPLMKYDYKYENIDATVTLIILSFAFLFAVLGGCFAYCIALPIKKEKIVLLATAISAIENLVLNVILIPVWGHNGAAITTLLAEVTVCIILITKLGEYKSVFKKGNIFLNFVKAIVAAFTFIPLKLILNAVIPTIWLNITVFVVVGVIVYLEIGVLLKNPILHMFLQLFEFLDLHWK